ncbi:hypothetical protein [Rhodospirillum sp. A1_3_36]|uniref:hypothetical protein n=1 Tax=Rhodospirillum sp. A1_3_36 TaxID=3391666 RepID=UPI0039A64966
MRALLYVWHLLKLLLYPPRLLLYLLHSTVIFISKPGARFLIPATLGGLIYWQADLVTGLADP